MTATEMSPSAEPVVPWHRGTSQMPLASLKSGSLWGLCFEVALLCGERAIKAEPRRRVGRSMVTSSSPAGSLGRKSRRCERTNSGCSLSLLSILVVNYAGERREMFVFTEAAQRGLWPVLLLVSQGTLFFFGYFHFGVSFWGQNCLLRILIFSPAQRNQAL